MTDDNQEIQWVSQFAAVTCRFAVQCRELHESNPYGEGLTAPPLQRIISHLATELWDERFSQSEIITAFKNAIEQLPHYAAGEERRGDDRDRITNRGV